MRSLILFRFVIFLFILFPINLLFSQGEVYIVLGSDTGIWDGLNVDTYHDFYKFDLYTNPEQNAYKVMDPSFRSQITDSYGHTLKLTWWIMGGNTFRYATNRNVPLNNTMVLYAMKKYYSDMIEHWGDEVSLHYHDWIWSDFNGDGIYYWNQSTKFSEFKEDFDLIMTQFLIEENVFPVSFRSGWHYMNNDWQNYIDKIIPFSLHDDYPHVRLDTVEPLDNIYDWSKSAEEFIPFHPSSQNYQVPGNLKGYDNRSIYMASMDTTLMEHIFEQAGKGINQVVCIWAHLPESNFMDNISRINQILHQTSAKFLGVKFSYCTAIEAMQRWMKSSDTAKPKLSFTYEQDGDKVNFVINTDENIFQEQPYVAVKDINENYTILQCYLTGTNEWKTVQPLDKKIIAKAGCAVTDTVGNLSTAFIKFLPDDIYIDNIDSGYSEIKGNWVTSSAASWGLDSRYAVVPPNDSVKIRWTPVITQSGLYNIFFQAPEYSIPVDHLLFKIYSGNQLVDSAVFNVHFSLTGWLYLSTSNLSEQTQNYIEMIAYNGSQVNEIVSVDVLKISPLIREKRLSIPQTPFDFGVVSLDDSVSFNLTLQNTGIGNLEVYGFNTSNEKVTTTDNFPIIIPSVGNRVIPLVFHPAVIGKVLDTLFVFSNDSSQSKYPVIYTVNVQPYFKLVDNSDSVSYKESGKWNFSSAGGAYGTTSRYAYLSQSPPAWAGFTAKLNRTGIYDYSEIVPLTVNSAKNALYVLIIDGIPVDSIYIDQNRGSGLWSYIGRSFIPANVSIELKIIDSGENTSNAVLRADAVKFSLVKEITGVNSYSGRMAEFILQQNYPNPFNPSTTISYSLPKEEFVVLKIFDMLGREVETLVQQNQKAGIYRIQFPAENLSSGIYFYRISAGKFVDTKKMILIK